MSMIQLGRHNGLSFRDISVNLKHSLLIMLIDTSQVTLDMTELLFGRAVASIVPLLKAVFSVGKATVQWLQSGCNVMFLSHI